MSQPFSGRPVFAHIDCNNYYASAERVFNPKLEGRPLVILSSNDGSAIARSNEAKALGIAMGEPWFKLQPLVKRHGLIGLSANFCLYGDISARVMAVLAQFSSDVENYSIDESFLSVERMRLMWPDFTEMGQAMRQRVRRWTHIPVSVGIGYTKTLAKAATYVAKKRPEFGGVFDMTACPDAELDALLSTIDCGEVWGVGRKIAPRLHAMGICTIQDLRRAPLKFIRTHFSVVLERTVAELQGVSCLELEEVAPPKKEIVSSKSFGEMVYSRDELGEALTTFVTRASEKLRAQQSLCGAVHVFVMTNAFRPEDPQYANGITVPLPNPSGDTRTLTSAALAGLRAIYRAGFAYKKTGVMLLDLSPAANLQQSLFEPLDARASHSDTVMATLDSLNARFGRDTVIVASAGTKQRWTPRAENRTQRYTTRWDELPKVYAK